ncbi:hypothetical protein M2152_001702 [Microbacteriaceae bacterium SG_E_30_P1]|uniref:Uncharacterized protein n=1 Tax=Antiquaquibacter oligotrophicus TaxID=2880260 RepID=A0ABT6KND4_9MICO|nr:hypothetical protein [Antiquaquibacter oligotrophicus]MDH6181520.1 hypothetical protein [Antiquaquibacter oligotrophicus]UDF12790.1 hypothetical protein LH407_11590 [Antiquaquibacter oligotrophicus]
MTTPQFDPERSAAIRAGLATNVESGHRSPHASLLAAAVLAGALVGVGLTAAVASTLSEEPVTVASGPALPDGVWPGASVVTIVEDAGSTRVSGPALVPLQPPVGATDVRVRITCLTSGVTKVGFSPTTVALTSTCTGDDRTETWSDLALSDDNSSLFASPEPGAEVVVSLQYLVKTETEWGVNAQGQTYGVASPRLGTPDLLAAVGVDGTLGYVESAAVRDLVPPYDDGIVEFNSGGPSGDALLPGVSGQSRSTDDLTQGPLDMHATPASRDPDRVIPLYAPDGTTVIGEFYVG